MTKPRLLPLLLLSTSLLSPAAAWAQDSTTSPDAAASPEPQAQETTEAEAPDISVPGGAIIVTGQRSRNVVRTSPQVISVLSSEEIDRTGEGDIAGALSRVTGLSVVGNGYVYVRGLGDRYSLALLNGSPLPSPEPLKRVVPLDIFPTNIIASSLVQKSYSANYPGEFGGGVINLTTKAIPTESYVEIQGGIGWDTESTNQLSYSYYGSKTDWTGYDNGNRDAPAPLASYLKGDVPLVSTSAQAAEIGSMLFTGRNSVIQKDDKTQPNFSAQFNAGTRFELGEATLGVIASAGYSNTTRTRAAIQQLTQGSSASPDQLYEDFQAVQTSNRVIANGLLGLGLEWGSNKIRWTNVYIHDTDKFTSLKVGNKNNNLDADFMQQKSAWYERQLFSTQVVGEFKVDSDTEIDLRAGYANSRRDAPFEIDAEYVRTNTPNEPYGNNFVNTLGTGSVNPTTISFSKLDEDVWSAGADVSHRFGPGWSGTVGYAYQINSRTNDYRQFGVFASGDPTAIQNFGLLRLDVLLQPGMWYIDEAGQDYNLELRDLTYNVGNFESKLLNHAFYGKVDGELAAGLTFDAGVRWEYAKETSTLLPVGGSAQQATNLKNEYLLPSATLTYEIEPGMQVRVNASKTIARPQFRELVYQNYYDPDSNRTYQGNPLLQDSELTNAEARFEYYFAPEQRVAVGGFYKKIDKPIESYLTGTESFITSYANAPSADLYGFELEALKYVPLDNWGSLFETRRLLLQANYTYTKSQLNVSADDTVQIYGASTTQFASDYFADGAPLTGQSKHLANVQIGFEDTEHLSQQTLLINYASKRTVSRGFIGTTRQPDIVEDPGLTLDLVIRQGIELGDDKEIELKFEGRNLTGRRHEEYQQLEDGRIEFNTYDLGRVFSASVTAKF